MIMIPCIYPYAYVNIARIEHIYEKGDRYYFLDNYGRWRITYETYCYLEKRGIPKYERKSPTTEPI